MLEKHSRTRDMKYNIISLVLVILMMALTAYFILSFIFHKEDVDMAVVYATLIIKGKREFHAIPEKIKQQVADILIDMELEDLIDEEEYKPKKDAE